MIGCKFSAFQGGQQRKHFIGRCRWVMGRHHPIELRFVCIIANLAIPVGIYASDKTIGIIGRIADGREDFTSVDVHHDNGAFFNIGAYPQPIKDTLL